MVSLASANFLSIVSSLFRHSVQVYSDNPSDGNMGSCISSDSLPDRFRVFELYENKWMACLEGMFSKQNLQHRRSLILLSKACIIRMAPQRVTMVMRRMREQCVPGPLLRRA